MKNLGETVIKIIFAPLVFLLMMSPFQWASAGTHDVAERLDIVNPGGHAGGATGQKVELSTKERVNQISADVLVALPYYVYEREDYTMKVGARTYPDGQERLDHLEAQILHGKQRAEDVSFVAFNKRPVGKAIQSIKAFDVETECYDENKRPVDAHYTGTSLIYKVGVPSSRICISLNGIKRNKISDDHLFGYLLPIVLHEVIHRIDRSDRANDLAESISNLKAQPLSISLQELKVNWVSRLQEVKRIKFIVDDMVENPTDICSKYQWLLHSFYTNTSAYYPVVDDNFLMADPISNYFYRVIAREIILNSVRVCLLTGESPMSHIKPGYIQKAIFDDGFRLQSAEEFLQFVDGIKVKELSEYELDLASDAEGDVFYDKEKALPLKRIKAMNIIQRQEDVLANTKSIQKRFNDYLESAVGFFGKEYKIVFQAPLKQIADYFHNVTGYEDNATVCKVKVSLLSTFAPKKGQRPGGFAFKVKSLSNLSVNNRECKLFEKSFQSNELSFLSGVPINDYEKFKSYIVSPKSKGGL